MTDPYDLQRFVDAQNPVFDQVRAELRAGRKRGHWMWFVFPQIRGLGVSPVAAKYSISSRAEAAAYLDHPVIGPRLRQCARLVTENSRPRDRGHPRPSRRPQIPLVDDALHPRDRGQQGLHRRTRKVLPGRFRPPDPRTPLTSATAPGTRGYFSRSWILASAARAHSSSKLPPGAPLTPMAPIAVPPAMIVTPPAA